MASYSLTQTGNTLTRIQTSSTLVRHVYSAEQQSHHWQFKKNFTYQSDSDWQIHHLADTSIKIKAGSVSARCSYDSMSVSADEQQLFLKAKSIAVDYQVQIFKSQCEQMRELKVSHHLEIVSPRIIQKIGSLKQTGLSQVLKADAYRETVNTSNRVVNQGIIQSEKLTVKAKRYFAIYP